MRSNKPNVIYSGSGTPVLLLHSSMSSKVQWYQLMKMMSRDYMMIALDLYGCGETPLPDNPETFSLSDEVELVESLLADLVPLNKPLHLVGHSYGGAVALRYCYKYKDFSRVHSLTLFEPVSFHILSQSEEAYIRSRSAAETTAKFLKEGKLPEAAEYFIDFWSGTGTFTGYPEMIREFFIDTIKSAPLDYKALFEETLTVQDYAQLTLPVCLMAGRESPVESQRIAQLLAANLPNCTMNWINSGHMAPVNQPDLVNPVIDSFIRKNS
jgi:pimeloyl-ACP methyl ester carboxylesterase